MLKRIAALTLLLAAQPATADDWDTADFALLTTAGTALVADWSQTRWIARNRANYYPAYYETNPILGDNPNTGDVDKYFAAAMLGTIVIADVLPSPYRKTWLGLVTVVEVGFVSRNYQIGIQMDF